MRPGPKRATPDEKQAKGTYQTCRDAPIHLITDKSTPLMPDYLPPAAEDIWNEELDRVMRAGICEADSSFFADYCCLCANVRALDRACQPVQAAQRSELRKMREILGIAGPSSRALRGTPGDTGNGSNPWAMLEA